MRRRARITKAAEQLLKLGKVRSLPVPVETLAKVAGATIRKGPLPKDLSGFLLREDRSPIIGVNGKHVPTRQRFTIAHELGHLLLHPKASYVDRSFPIVFRDERSSSAEVQEEIEANQFAADLLMPYHLLAHAVKGPVDIDDDKRIRKLAEKCNVSPQAMTFRLTNLGLTTTLTKS